MYTTNLVSTHMEIDRSLTHLHFQAALSIDRQQSVCPFLGAGEATKRLQSSHADIDRDEVVDRTPDQFVHCREGATSVANGLESHQNMIELLGCLGIATLADLLLQPPQSFIKMSSFLKCTPSTLQYPTHERCVVKVFLNNDLSWESLTCSFLSISANWLWRIYSIHSIDRLGSFLNNLGYPTNDSVTDIGLLISVAKIKIKVLKMNCSFKV